MTDLRTLQQALGGEIVNGRQLLCPGPGHSPRDRSLAVFLTPDGDIKVHSHAGDDWATCKDFIRERLGWPAWQPGDGRDRRVDSSRLKAFDRAAIEAESGPREWTPDELIRIARAVAIWNAAVDPRGTLAEKYLRSGRSSWQTMLPTPFCVSIQPVLGATRTPAAPCVSRRWSRYFAASTTTPSRPFIASGWTSHSAGRKPIA